MATKSYTIIVRGKRHPWAFDIKGKPEYAEEWMEDGLQINETGVKIPIWVVEANLIGPWCAIYRAVRWLRFW